MGHSKNGKAGWRARWRLQAVVLAAPVVLAVTGSLATGQEASVAVVPDADAFVRSLAPTGNYGGAGALSVSGAAAANGSGVQNGLFSAFMRFPMSNAVAWADSVFGGHDWIVTEIRLSVNEMAAPDNPIFDRGVGAFEIRWIAEGDWLEGTGTPKSPTSDGVTWQDLPLVLNSNVDRSLGVFMNRGEDGQESYSLALAEPFLTDLRHGGEVSLYLVAWSPEIGFTFNSRNFGNTNAQPALEVTAVANPKPQIGAIAVVGKSASVSFATVPNWTYTLQCASGLEAPGAGYWSNLLTVPAQPVGSNVVFLDTAAGPKKLYRLSVSP